MARRSFTPPDARYPEAFCRLAKQRSGGREEAGAAEAVRRQQRLSPPPRPDIAGAMYRREMAARLFRSNQRTSSMNDDAPAERPTPTIRR